MYDQLFQKNIATTTRWINKSEREMGEDMTATIWEANSPDSLKGLY